MFTLNGEAVVWRSIKQSCISDSTMEAEYVAASEASKKAVWLRKSIIELEIVPDMNLPITLYCDNSGAVANSKDPRCHKRSRHIDRINVAKITSKDNLADQNTKTLPGRVFASHLEGY